MRYSATRVPDFVSYLDLGSTDHLKNFSMRRNPLIFMKGMAQAVVCEIFTKFIFIEILDYGIRNFILGSNTSLDDHVPGAEPSHRPTDCALHRPNRRDSEHGEACTLLDTV